MKVKHKIWKQASDTMHITFRNVKYTDIYNKEQGLKSTGYITRNALKNLLLMYHFSWILE